jgi:hypothetical protein
MTLNVSRLNRPSSPLSRLSFLQKVCPRCSKANHLDFPLPNPSSFCSIGILGNTLPSTASVTQKTFQKPRSMGYIRFHDSVVTHIRGWNPYEPMPQYEEREYLRSEPAPRMPMCKTLKTRVRNGGLSKATEFHHPKLPSLATAKEYYPLQASSQSDTLESNQVHTNRLAFIHG